VEVCKPSIFTLLMLSFWTCFSDEFLVLIVVNLGFPEWDLGGLPSWLLEFEPSVKLRSSEEQYIAQV
jgi:hypothetical protein